jgi:prephenate dehydrogenase
MRRAEIIGLGMIGGSLGLALRAAGWHVTGSDESDGVTAARARALGVVDAVGEDQRSDLLVIATPASVVVGVANARLASQAVSGRSIPVVTDVAGVKSPIVEGLPLPFFVGGHPMAGNERSGLDGADATLFRGATWVLTPSPASSTGALEALRTVIDSLGARPAVMTASRHDQLAAAVSHVPHLSAAALLGLATSRRLAGRLAPEGEPTSAEEPAGLWPGVGGGEQISALDLCAGGFRDLTRIALSDPGPWLDIIEMNAGEIGASLDDLIEQLGQIREIVARHDAVGLRGVLHTARGARRSLEERPGSTRSRGRGPSPIRTHPILAPRARRLTEESEVDDPPGTLGDGVEIVGPQPG